MFYTDLKQNLNNPIYLKENINRFNDLNDNEIKKLFDDNEIDANLKTIIAEHCYERITILPFDIFVKILFYIENPYLFTSNYKNRIEKLSFSELLTLIYDAELDGPCLIEITKMDVFKNYLNYEIINEKGTKLQSFELLKILYSNNNIGKLSSIGTKIIHLLKNSSDYSDDIEILINYYLEKIIEKNQEINLDNDINSICIVIMNYYLKNHKLLTDRLIEFYILFRIKDLNLQDYCKKVVVTNQDAFAFGKYQSSLGKLEIFSKYIKKIFSPIIKNIKFKDKNAINDFLNLITLRMISHELGHIVKHKEVEKFQSNNPSYEELMNNRSIYYWYKNQLLHLFLGEEKYNQFHDKFIEENRADIFSIFDSSIQIDKYFKNSFSDIQLQNLCSYNAGDIIKFYTQKDDNKNIILSPMQKFYDFLSTYLPIEKNLPNLNSKSALNIMDNLLLGDQIPIYVLEELSKIASGKIKATNLYTETLAIINKVQSSDVEINVKKN